MSESLFDIDDFAETRAPEWVLIGEWGRCGLCGAKCGYNQGGSRTGAVCDDCAQVDSCRVREHNPVAERRESVHPHDVVVAHCENCTWWLNATHWHEGKSVEYTPDEIADAMAKHAHPRHTSHWGEAHEISEHDGLITAQQKRRNAYLARLAVSA